MEDRDLHGPLQRLLDVEALRRLDVLEVDPAEGGLEGGDDLDDRLGVGGPELDVEDVDVGEALEEDPLALHDRLAGYGADVAEAQYRGAVRYYCNQVPFGGVFVRILGVLFYLEARLCNTGRISQG